MTPRWNLIHVLVVLALLAIALALCLPTPFDGIFGMVLIGFALYPARLAGEQAIDWPSTFLCAACLVGLTLGVHYFGQWFAAHRGAAWPWRRTVQFVGIVLLLFVAGIAAIGITHQATWLATSEEKLTRRGSFREIAPAGGEKFDVNELER